MAEYLAVRRSLSAIVVLVDSRLGFTDIDRKLLDFVAPRLANGSVKLLALLTKADKLNRRDTALALQAASDVLGDVASERERRLADRVLGAAAAPASTMPRACSTPGRTERRRMIETFTIAARQRHRAQLPRRRPARRPGARLPAWLSRGGVRLGRAARAFRRSLSLRRARTCAATSGRRRRPTSRRIAPSTWSPTSRR